MEESYPQLTEAGVAKNDKKTFKESGISAEKIAKKSKKANKIARKKQNIGRSSKKNVIFTTIGVLGILGGIGCALVPFLLPQETLTDIDFPKLPSDSEDVNSKYSNLTGLPLADGVAQDAPTYCIQTPNGTDGARPQAGLTQAGVVFEAIAEAGITRFAAIYQQPTSAVIGPIRSLRIYYLEWDTPFDCTIVHAGGADDALAAVSNGGYKDLSEDYSYMYRGTNSARLWNNLFTTSANLARFSSEHGYTTSNINGFARMTPEESKHDLIDRNVAEKLVITEPATKNTSEVSPQVTQIALNFGSFASFNVVYNYNTENNTYKRSYGNGAPHEVYSCPDGDLGEINPENTCNLVQMAPAVVVALVVPEHKASDNYHEDISVLGSGDAYIFQNGYSVKGKWSKGTDAEQIKFFDEDGKELKLATGQTFVSAVPNYGSVEY